MSVVKTISDFVSHPTVIAVVAAFVTLYTSTITPVLPDYIKAAFNHPAFRFLVILLVAYTASAKKPIVAVVAAVAFLLIFNYFSEDEIVERFRGTRR